MKGETDRYHLGIGVGFLCGFLLCGYFSLTAILLFTYAGRPGDTLLRTLCALVEIGWLAVTIVLWMRRRIFYSIWIDLVAALDSSHHPPSSSNKEAKKDS
jgi:hypothetical protein